MGFVCPERLGTTANGSRKKAATGLYPPLPPGTRDTVTDP